MTPRTKALLTYLVPGGIVAFLALYVAVRNTDKIDDIQEDVDGIDSQLVAAARQSDVNADSLQSGQETIIMMLTAKPITGASTVEPETVYVILRRP